VADRPEADRVALREFGYNLGMAFQLVDDMLDYSAQQATLGKINRRYRKSPTTVAARGHNMRG